MLVGVGGVGWDASWRSCDAWAWYVGLLGVGWNVVGVLLMRRAWYVGLLGVGWDVAGVLVMRGRGGCGSWRGLEYLVENKPTAYFLR